MSGLQSPFRTFLNDISSQPCLERVYLFSNMLQLGVKPTVSQQTSPQLNIRNISGFHVWVEQTSNPE